jgi:hypothetical protein
MRSPVSRWGGGGRASAALGLSLALALAFLVGGSLPRANAQGAAPATNGAPGWYGFIPGRGWVGYAPGSAPVFAPGASAYRTAPGSYVYAPGWAGYAPVTAWAGYAPASSAFSPAVRVGPQQGTLSANGSRRRAATLFVDRNRPDLAYTLPAYKEYGTGRQVPLAKPWLPLSP